MIEIKNLYKQGKQSGKFNPEKSDIFSLGLSILRASNLLKEHQI